MTIAVILAGGASRRMGGNKPFHPFGASTLLETLVETLQPQVEALYINGGSISHPLRSAFESLELPLVFDRADTADLGPLSGVLSAISLAEGLDQPSVITAPCDMPHLPADYVERLMRAPSADVAYVSGDRAHPLCARWSSSLAGPLHHALVNAREAGGLPVMRFLDLVRSTTIAPLNEAAFTNVNAPDHLS